MIEDVFDPARLLGHDVLSSARVFHLPFVDELTDEADFCGHTWDAKLVEGPVVLIATDGQAHDLLAGARQRSSREGSILRNLGEDLQNTRSSRLNIVFLSAIERIDERITIRVRVNDEGQLLLVGRQEVFKVLRLNLRERLRAREVCGARIGRASLTLVCLVLEPRVLLVVDDLIDLTKVDAEVPVQINSSILNMRAVMTLSICVLASGNDLVLRQPVLLNVCHSIDIKDGQEHKLVLLEQMHEVFVLLYNTLLDELEDLVVVHSRRDHFSRVSSASHQDGGLLATHYVRVLKLLVAELASVDLLLFICSKVIDVHYEFVVFAVQLDKGRFFFFSLSSTDIDLKYIHVTSLS